MKLLLFLCAVVCLFSACLSYTNTQYFIDGDGQTAKISLGHAKVSPKDFRDTSEANRHYDEMNERTACRDPRPVVVDIQEFYRNSTIGYLPHCTILHRCDRESGCCGNSRVCSAKTKSYVQLTFFMVPIDKAQSGTEVVKLTFTNHTACQCEENLLDDVEIQNPTTSTTTSAPWANFDSSEEKEYEDEHNCKRCPRPFAVRILGEDICSCDCFHGDKDCLDIKEGHKLMAPEYSNCVRRRDCEAPTCYTGEFDVMRGTCPRMCRSGSTYDAAKGRCVKIRHKRKQHRSKNSHQSLGSSESERS